jgi:hypothetical protein
LPEKGGHVREWAGEAAVNEKAADVRRATATFLDVVYMVLVRYGQGLKGD